MKCRTVDENRIFGYFNEMHICNDADPLAEGMKGMVLCIEKSFTFEYKIRQKVSQRGIKYQLRG